MPRKPRKAKNIGEIASPVFSSFIAYMNDRSFKMACISIRILHHRKPFDRDMFTGKKMKKQEQDYFVIHPKVLSDLHKIKSTHRCDDCRKKMIKVCSNGTWLCPPCVVKKTLPGITLVMEYERNINDVLDIIGDFL